MTETSNLPMSDVEQVNDAKTNNKQKRLRNLILVIIALELIIILLMAVGLWNALGSDISGEPNSLLDNILNSAFIVSCFTFPILVIIALILGLIGFTNVSWTDKRLYIVCLTSFFIFGNCYVLLILGLLGS